MLLHSGWIWEWVGGLMLLSVHSLHLSLFSVVIRSSILSVSLPVYTYFKQLNEEIIR